VVLVGVHSTFLSNNRAHPNDANAFRSWWFQGLAFTGLWVIGHECGHRAFSSSRRVCDAVGFVLHTLLWTPYFSWRLSHARHHATHASIEKDEVYVPKTRSDLGIPQHSTVLVHGADGQVKEEEIDWEEIFEDTPIYTLYMLLRQQFLAFPAYLLWNVSGQRTYPKGTNHFNRELLSGLFLSSVLILYPASSVIFKPNERNAVLISNAGILSMIFLTSYSIARFGFGPVLKLYLIPWLLVTHWFIMITYLHHTSSYLPHYREGEWTYERGAAATVDRDFLGWQGRFFLHDVAHYHVIHHFFPKIPWYNGEEATQYLKEVIGDAYQHSDKPVFADLWDVSGTPQSIYD
jgi:fatty acid desaturase